MPSSRSTSRAAAPIRRSGRRAPCCARACSRWSRWSSLAGLHPEPRSSPGAGPSAGGASQEIEKALGLTPSERALGAVARRPCRPSCSSAALAVDGRARRRPARAAGLAAAYEPTPGWLPRPPVRGRDRRGRGRRRGRRVVVHDRCAAGRPRRLPGRRRRGACVGRGCRCRARAVARGLALSAGRGGPSTTTVRRARWWPGSRRCSGYSSSSARCTPQLSGLRDHPATWGWTADFAVRRRHRASSTRSVLGRPAGARSSSSSPISAQLRVHHPAPAGSDSRPTGSDGRRCAGALPWTLGARPVARPATDEVALGPRAVARPARRARRFGRRRPSPHIGTRRRCASSGVIARAHRQPTARSGSDALFTQAGMLTSAGRRQGLQRRSTSAVRARPRRPSLRTAN